MHRLGHDGPEEGSKAKQSLHKMHLGMCLIISVWKEMSLLDVRWRRGKWRDVFPYALEKVEHVALSLLNIIGQVCSVHSQVSGCIPYDRD